MRKNGIRNSSLFSMQPNGNSSIFANILTGGIEPVFLQDYTRTVIVGEMPEHIKDVTPLWYQGEWHETSMFKFVQEGDEQILRGVDKNGTVYKIDKNRGLTKEVTCQDYGVRYLINLGEWNPKAKWAVTTDDISVADHISDLKGFAKAVDSACSKTVNLPNDYNFEDFQNIYLDAYKTGFIKGLTTFRAGTMTTVLSATDQKTDLDEEIILADVKVPDNGIAEVKVLRDHEGGSSRKWYVTVMLNENKAPIALFVQTNAMEKTVTTNDAIDRLLTLAHRKGIPEKFVTGVEHKFIGDNNSTKIARAIGLLLRHGVRIKNIVAEIDKIEGITFSSFLFHIKKLLSSYVKDGEKLVGVKCIECDGQLVYESGCQKCINCGNSKCG
jgi:ribonucleoside-diphosphate reductase alpha chain